MLTRLLTAAEKRRWHEEWVDKVVLPGIGGLSRKQQEVAQKILLKKSDMKLAGPVRGSGMQTAS